jgi:hypothetical protein
MSLNNYEQYKKHSRIIIIAGVGMMFETIKYANIIGIIMITSGFIINHYYDKKIIFEKQKEIILTTQTQPRNNENILLSFWLEPIEKPHE